MGLFAELAKVIPGVEDESQLLALVIVIAIVIIGLLAFNFGIQFTGGRHGLTADVEAGITLAGRDGFQPTTLIKPDVAKYYQQKFGSKIVTPRNVSVSAAPSLVAFQEGYISGQQRSALDTKRGAGLFSDVTAPGISSMTAARASVMARNATDRIYAHTPAVLDQ